MRTNGMFVALVLTAGLALPAFAQPAPPNVTGRVLEVAGEPIAGAEVYLQGADRVARTGETGAFSFSDVRSGTRLITVRRLGYLPATRTLDVSRDAQSVDITLVRSTPSLDTVLIEAKVKILAGVVADSAGHPIAGARVEMIGATHGSVTAGPDGWFKFTDVHTGPIVLRGMKAGWAVGMASLRLEDSRGVVIHLYPLDTLKLSADKQLQQSGMGNSDANAWAETQMRLVARGGRATVLSRQDLEPFDALPLGQAIERAPAAQLVSMELVANGVQACVLLDGRRVLGNVFLDTFDTQNVEFVELYPPGTEVTGVVARYMRDAGCRPTTTSGYRRGIFYAVVWGR